MADLRNGETLVGPKNDSAYGPAGTRKRNRHSLYLLVGGSSDIYDVTVNFETKNGHWCEKESGARCHGNGNGKGQKYGIPSARDKHNPIHWCKHVQAALADVEGLAEAEERTAAAFGERTITATVKPAVPAFEPVPVKAEPVKGSSVDRLAVLEAEKAEILKAIAAEEKSNALRDSVAELVKAHGWDAVRDAVKVA